MPTPLLAIKHPGRPFISLPSSIKWTPEPSPSPCLSLLSILAPSSLSQYSSPEFVLTVHIPGQSSTRTLAHTAPAVEPLPARAAAQPLAVVPHRSSPTSSAIRGTSVEFVTAIQTHRRSFAVRRRHDRAAHQLDHPRLAVRTPRLIAIESFHSPQGQRQPKCFY
jgi:hypothetical protein